MQFSKVYFLIQQSLRVFFLAGVDVGSGMNSLPELSRLLNLFLVVNELRSCNDPRE